MATRERRLDRAARLTEHALRTAGSEIREARLGAGVSQAAVAKAAGMSRSELGRIERRRAPWATVDRLARAGAVVGLDLSVRFYPAGPPIRDKGQTAVAARLHAIVHPALRWRSEVGVSPERPLQAWDGSLDGADGFARVEIESRIRDGQALLRRIEIKKRDGNVEIVILVVADTRANRAALKAFEPLFSAAFPCPSGEVRRALRNGRIPKASGILLV